MAATTATAKTKATIPVAFFLLSSRLLRALVCSVLNQNPRLLDHPPVRLILAATSRACSCSQSLSQKIFWPVTSSPQKWQAPQGW